MSGQPSEELTYLRRVRRLRSLGKAALAAYGLEAAVLRLIQCRQHATTFRVDTPTGANPRRHNDRYVPGRYLLRIHGPVYQSTASVRSEMDWLTALVSETDQMVPCPVPTLAGDLTTETTGPGISQPRACSLLRWMPGNKYRRPTAGRMSAVGEAMAKLHNHAESWMRPVGFTRRRLDLEGLLGERSGFPTSPREIWTSLSPRHAELVEAVSDRLSFATDRLGTGTDSAGLIHADLHLANVLFVGKEARVIDFDDSGFGPAILDIAVSLFSSGGLTFREDFIRGYARRREVPHDQLRFLETFIAARRLSDAVGHHWQLRHDPAWRQELSLRLEPTVQAIEIFLRDG